MNDSRAEIFSRLNKASQLKQHEVESSITSINKRITEHRRGVLPAFNEDLLERFIAKAEKVEATVKCISSTSELSDAVYEYLSENNIAPNIAAAPSALLKNLEWKDEVSIEYRASLGEDLTTLTVAYAGVAETGTLMLCSSKESPTSLNFLPDNNICVIQQGEIFPYVEDVWDKLRKETDVMPRAVNFISGPSRTADVEQTIQLGAHGPRRLHIIIIKN